MTDTSPHGHCNTSTFIAALRANGLMAPAVFDGAINGELFPAYVVQVLVPTLATDDIVAMDNLSCHKKPAVRRAIGTATRQSRPEPDRAGPRPLLLSHLRPTGRSEGRRSVSDLSSYRGPVQARLAGKHYRVTWVGWEPSWAPACISEPSKLNLWITICARAWSIVCCTAWPMISWRRVSCTSE